MANAHNSKGDFTIEELGQMLERWFAPVARTGQVLFPMTLALAFLLLAGGIFLLVYPIASIPAQYIALAMRLMVYLASIGFLALLAAHYHSPLPGWLGVGTVILLRAGIIVLGILAGRYGTAESSASTALVSGAASLSENVTFFAVLDLLIFYTLLFYNRHREAVSQRIAYIDVSKSDVEKPGLIPRCWQMSRCRPGVRMTCPNYIERIPCWRRRSGCFCDRNLADYLLKQAASGESDEVIDVQRLLRQPAVSAMRERMRGSRRRRKWREQMKLCHECPLYIEHQEYKYRHLSWIGFPLTLAIVAGCWTFYDMGYHLMSDGLEKGIKSLVAQGILPSVLYQASAPSLSSSFAFEIVLLAVLTLLLLSYVIAFTDVVFLKWKL